MTQAQKIAKDKFKKAIEYRKKTGVSLKEAFAHIYGKKVGAVKKKAALKKNIKKVLIESDPSKNYDIYAIYVNGEYDKRVKEKKSKKSYKKIVLPKKKATPKKVAAIKIIEKGENKSSKAKAVYQQVRTKKGTYKGLKKVGAVKKKSASKKVTGSHKDTKSHNVNIRVVSGLPSYKDPDMAREIELYADSDSTLYFQRRQPILINLGKKYKKGTYDIQKAAKLWRYYIDAALEKYNKEFGSRGDKWFDLMSVSDRNLLALEYAQNTKDEFDLGNFTDK